MKKAGSRAGFFSCSETLYFLSSGFDSLGEAGYGDEDDVEDGVEDDELAAPPAVLDAAPVPPGVVVVLLASAPGAGEGVGAVVVGALGAGGGVTTLASSFLQAVRPTATRAAMISERVMFSSL